jgi:hypothetical protein
LCRYTPAAKEAAAEEEREATAAAAAEEKALAEVGRFPTLTPADP